MGGWGGLLARVRVWQGGCCRLTDWAHWTCDAILGCSRCSLGTISAAPTTPPCLRSAACAACAAAPWRPHEGAENLTSQRLTGAARLARAPLAQAGQPSIHAA